MRLLLALALLTCFASAHVAAHVGLAAAADAVGLALVAGMMWNTL